MKIEIELRAGADHHEPTKKDIQRNIDSLERLREKGAGNCVDHGLMLDTLSILRCIQDQLPLHY